MNCQSFESAVNDLARDQMMDAAVRNRALAHAVACQRCAARLADEQALTAGLRKIGESRDEAPAHVEASLREAFRASVGEKGQPAIARIDSTRHNWGLWAAAAAAILVVAFLALSAARLQKGEANKPQTVTAEQKEERQTGAPGGEVKPFPDQPVPHVDRPQIGAHKSVRPRTRRDPSAKEVKPVEAQESRTEVATEFIPLIHGDEISPSDGGQIVRVEMPRGALVAFGLPMNMERAGERVKADVVVGNDGVARAIRFVH
jgi:hypothetical protein